MVTLHASIIVISIVLPLSARNYCTNWIDKDNPGGVGDFETVPHQIHRTLINDIIKQCPKSYHIQAKSGTTVYNNAAEVLAAFGLYTNFYYPSTGLVTGISGFACNWNHPKNKAIPRRDFAVRYCCKPTDTPIDCTNWIDKDNPGGVGDFETVPHQIHRTLINDIIKQCPKSYHIQAKSGTTVYNNAAEVLAAFGLYTSFYYPSSGLVTGISGFACNWNHPKNRRKPRRDFAVRYCCKPTEPPIDCTNWIDKDNPGGVGDFETVPHQIHRSLINDIIKQCPQSYHIQAKSGTTVYNNAAQVLAAFGLYTSFYYPSSGLATGISGFTCNWNHPKNRRKPRRDFAVRYCCKPNDTPIVETSCFTCSQWFDRDDPGATGDWELSGHSGIPTSAIKCKSYIIQVKENSGSGGVMTNSAQVLALTGNHATFHFPSSGFANAGFVCKNSQESESESKQESSGKFQKCKDFSVRFCCEKKVKGK